ncbi:MULTISPECIES: NYN domain-containing protein [Corynebacterium]|uniref:NYN domain-containing protein n=1 Tax=Corynebacterium TaxID=1716 RepID=UPI00254F34CA|nr:MULTISPECIES: NYN domain-containing protein [Corynebacterium]MDK6260927.1 NYN domain-containing protein [Corynebacterium frankenforstense]MDK8895370.1 NYN domain-containing protein [Corynebacterium sp. MSK006]
MLERTLVFVDTSYLLASFYNSWETGARAQLEIDLPDVVHVLGEMIENQLHQPIHRQLWYDGIPDSGPHRYQRALRTCDGVQLRAGQLIEWGERRTQKAVDTRLVADMVLAAVDQQCSDIVLVSGDADMIPGVSEASRRGVRVHLYGFGWDSMSSALRHHCDTTTILDPREDFHDSMHLEVLEGPVPPVVREPAAGAEDGSEDDDGDSVPGDATTGDQPPSTSPERPEAPATPTAADQEAQGTACAESAGASIADAAPAATGADASASGASDAADSSGAAASGAASAEAGKHEKAKDAGASGEAPKETGPEGKEQAEQQGPEAQAQQASAAGADGAAAGAGEAPATAATHPKTPAPDADSAVERDLAGEAKPKPKPRPKPSMMAPKRRLRSRYVPLPNEVWASAGFQTPFDVGQQYATWWYENAATGEQRDQAHMLSGGGLPPEVDRPLLQFACETLHEYTLSDKQRVNLRDGFHAGIRGLLINVRRQN